MSQFQKPFFIYSKRDAHPAAPDVSEKNQCESKNAMLSAAINAYCSSSDCLQKPRSNQSKIRLKQTPIVRKIEPKPARIHPDSTLQHQTDARSTPEAPKIDFQVILECIFQLKMRRKSLKFCKNPKKFSKTFLDANLL